MGLIRFFAILLAVVLAALTGLYAWLGGFERIEVSKGGWGPAEIMFATHRGPYKNIGESWAAFEEAWTAAGLDACDGLAVNLDPPETDPAALRSILGCRIDALDEATKTKMADAFPTAILPATEAYLARFPYKNELSYVLGPLKVYPAMRKRFEADGAAAGCGDRGVRRRRPGDAYRFRPARKRARPRRGRAERKCLPGALRRLRLGFRPPVFSARVNRRSTVSLPLDI